MDRRTTPRAHDSTGIVQAETTIATVVISAWTMWNSLELDTDFKII
jgi:hypothetical protein